MTDYRALAAAKRASRDALIPQEYLIPSEKLPGKEIVDVTSFASSAGLLTQKEVQITSADVSVLLEKLSIGEWSAQETLEAHIKTSVVAHQLTNPLTEIMLEDARVRAKELDLQLKETGRLQGPLHGLPISLKDQFSVKGYDTTIGYVSYIGQKASNDAVLVGILKRAGAIIFCRTNCPQTMMIGQTKNEIFGETSNPHNRSLTSGGSSGGEGALIASFGSPLGVGTDIGGSVRIPSNYNGLFGLRPSSNRFPYYGAVNSNEGQEMIPSVLGPLSRSFSGLYHFSKTVLSAEPWNLDPLVPRMPWNEDSFAKVPQKLCFGIMWNDGLCRPDPPFKRALEEVVDSLKKAGHEVIDWEPPVKQEDIQGLLGRIFGVDSGEDVRKVLEKSGEPLLEGVIVGKESEKYTVWESWQLAKQRTELQKIYLDHWQASKTPTGRPMDAIICPGGATTAHPPSQHPYIGYTSQWNLLDYSAGTFPVSKVSDEDTEYRSEPVSSIEKDLIQNYSPQTMENAPVGLQLVGRKYEEEKVLGMLSKVLDAMAANQ